MTIYEKPRSEVFASNAPESEVSTFTAWLRGLGIAFDETNGLPEFSGLNNVFNLLNQYIKYLEQNGFAEWSSDLEYPIGAGVRVGAVWYRAKTQNTNKPPATSQNDWELFLNASALTYENPLYIENNVVKVRGATQIQRGVVQFANATEVANKANVSKAINPANVGQTFGQSLDQNGWCRLPSGLIMQWGSADAQIAGATIPFPITFPNSVLSVVVTDIATSGTPSNLAVRTKSMGSFVVIGSNNDYFNWFAIGY